ncbi:MAG: zf-TFIIB domain-containing protein [Nitrospirota bacterium]
MRPSEREAEYIARTEFDKLRKLEDGKHKKLKTEEKKKLKELHYLKCPKCGMELIEIDYKHIKIDKCSECEGIWLDAGELETVSNLEKSGLDKLFGVFKR